MIYNVFSKIPATGPVKTRDSGASSIVMLMMTLVFLPVTGIHVAMLLAESGATVNVGQLAGIVQSLVVDAAGFN